MKPSPPSARVEGTSSEPASGGTRAERRAISTGPDVVSLEFQDHRLFHELLGQHDEHVKAIEKSLGVRIGVAGNSASISGDQVERELAGRVMTQLYGVLERGFPVYSSDVDYARPHPRERPHRQRARHLPRHHLHRGAKARDHAEERRRRRRTSTRSATTTSSSRIGPAGTGKTYLAMAMGVAASDEARVHAHRS